MIPDDINKQQGAISFISWSVKELNNVVKQSKTFSPVKSLKPDVIFIQETHLNINFQKRLNCKWIGQTYHSRFNHKAGGAALLIGRAVPFELSEVISDASGTFVVVVAGRRLNTPLILANVYAPNWDSSQFFVNFFQPSRTL